MRKDKPSLTARKVALAIITLGAQSDTQNLLPPGVASATEQLLQAAGVAGPQEIRFARSSYASSIYNVFDWMMPGQYAAFADRKAFFDRQARLAIQDGAQQMLVLGAGYDVLAWRLAQEFPDVRFIEIDHPATARVKAIGLERMGMPGNLRLNAVDLAIHPLTEVVTAATWWDEAALSLILAEGLVMYLTKESVGQLFHDSAAVTARGSRLAFSYIPSGVDGLPYVGRWSGLMHFLQKLTGEPWLWSVRPDELNGFLSPLGWSESPDPKGDDGPHGIEHYAVAWHH
jgi:methyltransferase (TIGR00027 family)